MTFLHHRQRVGGSVVARCCHSCKRTVCCPLSLLSFKGEKKKAKIKIKKCLSSGSVTGDVLSAWGMGGTPAHEAGFLMLLPAGRLRFRSP